MKHELRITNYEYWKSFYENFSEEKPSLFAIFVLNHFKEKSKILELGCGNGRDAMYFIENGHKVLGIDQSKSAIEYINKKLDNFSDSKFIEGDFTNLNYKETFDVVYSRFTLHSVSREEQNRATINAYNALVKNGLLCIEARGKLNDLFGKGVKVIDEEDAYIYDGHYRRFLDFDLLKKDLIGSGFIIVYSEEERNFAPFGSANEFFIRILVRKP